MQIKMETNKRLERQMHRNLADNLRRHWESSEQRQHRLQTRGSTGLRKQRENPEQQQQSLETRRENACLRWQLETTQKGQQHI